mgnify:CR=1
MIQKIIHFIKREKLMLGRYLFVGGSSFAVKIGTYAVLSRLIWVDGPRTFENIIAIIFAVVYNYTLHRFWTFKHQAPASGSAGRYVAVVLAGNALDATFFYVGHDLLGIYDFLTIVLSTGLLACVSFFTHRLFTFHNDPWKKKERVVSSE